MSIKMTANAPPAAVAAVATVVDENSTTVIANNVLAPTTPPSNNSAASSNSTTSTSEEEDIIVDVEDEIDIIGHHHHYKLHSSPEHSNHHHSDEGIHSHHRSSSETGSRTTSKCNSEISCSDSANSSDEMKTDKTKESLADKLVAANAEAAKQKQQQQQQQAEKSNGGQPQQGNGSALAAASLLTAAVKAQAAAAVAALQRNQEEARLDIQDGYKKSKPGGHHAHSNCGPHTHSNCGPHGHSHSHAHGEKGGCCNNLPTLPGPSKQKVEVEEDLGPIDPNDPGMQKKDDVYKCRFCDRTFCYLCHLRVHERVHTGEKPYKCSFCDVTFSQLGSLTVHMRIHTGEKPYECRICKKKFRHINSLRRHQRQVHRKQPGDEDTEVIASRPASSVFFGNHMGYQNPLFAQQQQEAAAAHSHATSIQQAAAHLQLQQQSLAANQLYLQQQAAAQQAAILRQRQLQQLQLTKQIYAQSALRSISSDGATTATAAATTTSSDHPSSNQAGQQLVQQLQQQRSMSLQDTTTRTQIPMTIDQKRQQLLQNANAQALLQLHQAALTGQSSAQLLKRSAAKDANTSPVAEKYQKLTTSPVIAGQLAKQQTSPKPTMMAPPSLPIANSTSSSQATTTPSTTQPLTDLVKMIEKGEAPDMNGLTSQERKQMKLKLAKYVMNVLSEDDEESSKLRQDFQKKTTDRRFESTDSAICVNNSEMDCHVDVV